MGNSSSIQRYEFTGDLYQGPRGGYYIDFPFDVEKEFGTKKQVKVKSYQLNCLSLEALTYFFLYFLFSIKTPFLLITLATTTDSDIWNHPVLSLIFPHRRPRKFAPFQYPAQLALQYTVHSSMPF